MKWVICIGLAIGIGVLAIVAARAIRLTVTKAKKRKAKRAQRAKNMEEVKANGIPAEAIIVSTEFSHHAASVGKMIDCAVFSLKLEWPSPVDGEHLPDNPRSIFKSFSVPIPLERLLMKKGATVPVLVHPCIPSLAILDENRMKKMLDE